MSGRGVHELKTWPLYFDAICDGTKPFDVRWNDRGFQVGDELRLREWNPDHVAPCSVYNPAGYTGRGVVRVVTFVLPGPEWGIQDGFVVLGLVGTAALPVAAPRPSAETGGEDDYVAAWLTLSYAADTPEHRAAAATVAMRHSVTVEQRDTARAALAEARAENEHQRAIVQMVLRSRGRAVAALAVAEARIAAVEKLCDDPRTAWFAKTYIVAALAASPAAPKEGP